MTRNHPPASPRRTAARSWVHLSTTVPRPLAEHAHRLADEHDLSVSVLLKKAIALWVATQLLAQHDDIRVQFGESTHPDALLDREHLAAALTGDVSVLVPGSEPTSVGA